MLGFSLHPALAGNRVISAGMPGMATNNAPQAKDEAADKPVPEKRGACVGGAAWMETASASGTKQDLFERRESKLVSPHEERRQTGGNRCDGALRPGSLRP